MRRSTCGFILLAILLCNGAKGDTLELPRTGNAVPGLRYEITTTRQADKQLVGEHLEHLSNAWDLLFADFVKDARIEPQKRLHRVIFYRDKSHYVASLRSIEPDIDRTNGFYHAPEKTVHFFSTEAKILFHEGTHQILAERFFYEKQPTFRNNFWAVEGIALFMETLKIEDKHYQIGDILADRLYAAKVQSERGYRMSIQRLTAMSAAEIQSSTEELLPIYRQSVALTHWLMFAEEGRYRPALFELLRQTYRNEATPETLSELTGFSYAELDARYAEFLNTIPAEPAKM
ncbi:MAG: hypothetical protein FWE95_07655 [Planctomycetaceae bacterium]|nr:hypothetical protein [Planctomycetaceae bacterium]